MIWLTGSSYEWRTWLKESADIMGFNLVSYVTDAKQEAGHILCEMN